MTQASPTPLLDRLFDYLRKQPKCKHDGTTPPCVLCIIKEAQAKRKS